MKEHYLQDLHNHHFLNEVNEQWDTTSQTPEISAAAMEALKHHNYTGNVRELINILQRAVTMCEGKIIQPDDLMLEHVLSPDASLAAAPTPEKTDDTSLDTYMEDIEKQMLEDALKAARYNKTRAAEILGISFRSLRYKLKKFGID